MADREFSLEALEAAFDMIWNHLDGLRIKYYGDNIYQFFFYDNEADVIRLERGLPWLFKQYVIHLRKWKVDMNIINEDYTIISTWVQLWELTEFCKTSKAARKIGGRIGRVLEVMAVKVRRGEGRIMKARIELNVTKTLKQSIKVASSNCTTHEILLRYERLGLYCSYYGFIGHEFKNCSKFLEDSQDQQQPELK
ncbi:uncharacterized protein LOC107607559 [Arachis ipaensis]|uniref:uncharacterized protein LOC107607559 n=1 Tax=Arachis ipaensis TaxID=130454 RepID=UPI0007AF8D0A|nr:uncharacterized protein LOC107607559 [Arachis ipaensis]XP_025665062.1 uncharacterized protein LOC112763665 [Arachis hypogaea]